MRTKIVYPTITPNSQFSEFKASPEEFEGGNISKHRNIDFDAGKSVKENSRVFVELSTFWSPRKIVRYFRGVSLPDHYARFSNFWFIEEKSDESEALTERRNSMFPMILSLLGGFSIV